MTNGISTNGISTNGIHYQKNVLGGKLQTCSTQPLTGFYRTGCCETGSDDPGRHTVCTHVTERFLEFSVARGNDLVTPAPHYGFPGLRAGDRWCVCVLRWREALEEGCAPPVVLEATHEEALRFVTLEDLRRHVIGLSEPKSNESKSDEASDEPSGESSGKPPSEGA